MKFSIVQVENAISKMKYKLLGYGSDQKDLSIDIEFVQADPGTGSMVDAMVLKATAPPKVDTHGNVSKVQTSMVVEIYPEQEKQPPRASVIESFTVEEKY